MRIKNKMLAATAFMFTALTAVEATGFASDQPLMMADQDLANKEMSAGDWSAAEAALLGAEAAPEDAVFAKLNLAFVYSTTGRKDMAAAIYQEILEGKANPYALTVSGQPRRVKSIAKVALAQLDDR